MLLIKYAPIMEQNKTVNFELIGGEVTTIPGFLEILQKNKRIQWKKHSVY